LIIDVGLIAKLRGRTAYDISGYRGDYSVEPRPTQEL